MKSQNGGMLWVDRGGDRGSCAILTRNFSLSERSLAQKAKEASLWARCRAGALHPVVKLSRKDVMNRKGGEFGFVTLWAFPPLRARPP
jgi:hypothetical protein